jgi:hypothetical protein
VINSLTIGINRHLDWAIDEMISANLNCAVKMFYVEIKRNGGKFVKLIGEWMPAEASLRTQNVESLSLASRWSRNIQEKSHI